MRLLALNCEHCGAPLEVPLLVRHVTCEYCSSQLEVRRDGANSFTEVVEAMEARAEPLGHDVELLKRHKELLDLDRQWMRERKRYGFGSHGEIRVPSETSMILGGGIILTLGILLCFAGGYDGGSVLWVSGMVLVVGAIATIACLVPKAEDYDRKQRLYRQRRGAICRAIRDGTESLSDPERWLPPCGPAEVEGQNR